MADYVTVSGFLSNSYPVSKMFDGNKSGNYNFWHSAHINGWVEIVFPSPKLLTSVIITRRTDCCNHRYKSVCLSINGNEANSEICTDAQGYGAPLLRGNEIHFEIMPTLTSRLKLQWGNDNDNFAQIAELEFKIENPKLQGNFNYKL